jgi:CDP-paratose 2-epimerase
MKVLVSGSAGLIGGEVVSYFAARGNCLEGIDNNMRADFFGPQGDTRWNTRRLESRYRSFRNHNLDIRNRTALFQLFAAVRPDLVVHAAAQPSHDLAASRPLDDFDVNATGTINMLEATRLNAPDAAFVYLSTNKVYGDSPNRLRLKELDRRWEYDDPNFSEGIPETFSIDASTHSVFGASKVAADVMVQEYGKYFGMKTCCLRGGCLTGPNHSGVELHGFLSFLIKTNIEERTYKIFGYKGKQVRDNIHALDVARFIECFAAMPRTGETYNIGGGRANSCSILEAFDLVGQITGKPMKYEYVEQNRIGDHICYISDLAKARAHYPEWDVSVPLDRIFEEVVASWPTRLDAVASAGN